MAAYAYPTCVLKKAPQLQLHLVTTHTCIADLSFFWFSVRRILRSFSPKLGWFWDASEPRRFNHSQDWECSVWRRGGYNLLDLFVAKTQQTLLWMCYMVLASFWLNSAAVTSEHFHWKKVSAILWQVEPKYPEVRIGVSDTNSIGSSAAKNS